MRKRYSVDKSLSHVYLQVAELFTYPHKNMHTTYYEVAVTFGTTIQPHFKVKEAATFSRLRECKQPQQQSSASHFPFFTSANVFIKCMVIREKDKSTGGVCTQNSRRVFWKMISRKNVSSTAQFLKMSLKTKYLAAEKQI